MVAAQHRKMFSNSPGPSASQNIRVPVLVQGRSLDSPPDAEPQGGPSQLRVEVTVLRAHNVPNLRNIFGLKFFVTVASQATEKKTPSVSVKGRTARWGESLGAFILQPSTPLVLRLYAKRFARRDTLIGTHEMIPVESQTGDRRSFCIHQQRRQTGWTIGPAGHALLDSRSVTEHNFLSDLAHQCPRSPIDQNQRLAF
ncbi:hypothetical protein EDB92DRAFT_1465435 [Lactarius akahatsu]|uniref:C2 domain-containing protein n=1 Tax=Lactarius akahatsu TaxID=416441 RepID=A0AAD4QAE4_9AGAM|nr:hypothetical protein EDB92DRAFT_1465435 [Lactarius akahatsu]